MAFPPTFRCFASVVPNRKIISAQLSKTLVNRCLFFYINFKNNCNFILQHQNKSYICRRNNN